jgi:DNA topoisomerase IB
VTGKVVDLSPDSEEVAGFYAVLMETDHAKDAKFNSNFFSDWLKVLKTHPLIRPLLPPPYLCAAHTSRSATR